MQQGHNVNLQHKLYETHNEWRHLNSPRVMFHLANHDKGVGMGLRVQDEERLHVDRLDMKTK
jgi:hypothetical protein